MTKGEEAAALKAVFARRGLRVPQSDEDWKALAMALMVAHEPEFQERGEPGRPNSLSEVEDLVCHFMLYYIRHRWNIPEDLRERTFTAGKTLSELEACRQLGEAIKINPETLKSRLARYRSTRKTITKFLARDPEFMTQLREGRDKANKILKSYLDLHPEYGAEVEDFMQWFNEAVDKHLGEN